MKIKIRLLTQNFYRAEVAISAAEHFSKEYADRKGVRNGVVFSYGDFNLYVYRTMTETIVVREI